MRLAAAPKRVLDLWRRENVLLKDGDRMSLRVPAPGVFLLRAWSH